VTYITDIAITSDKFLADDLLASPQNGFRRLKLTPDEVDLIVFELRQVFMKAIGRIP